MTDVVNDEAPARGNDGLAAIENWTTGYVDRHPKAAIATVGEQFVLGVRTLQWFFIDLFTGFADGLHYWDFS